MKLRLDRNTIRLRLDDADVARLARGESLAHAIEFGPRPEDRFTYELRVDDACIEMAASLEDRGIVIRIPAAMAVGWAEGAEIGLEGGQFVDDDRMLGVLVEKDLRCPTC